MTSLSGPLPQMLADITPAWLTAALRDNGFDCPDAASVALEPIEGIIGATGQIGRLRVGWDGPCELPSSFVAKAPNHDDFAKLANQTMRFYEREAGFYREVADRIDLPKPKGYVNLFDPDTDHNLLIIEDISPAADGDVTVGTDPDTAARLLELLARLHGHFWMDEQLVQPWLHTWDRESFWSNAWIGQLGWDALAEREPDFYPPDLAEVIKRRYLYDTAAWCAEIDARPWTYCHGDFQLDNMLFRPDGEIVIVDWQLGLRNCPGNDVAWFLATSCWNLVEHERDLLDGYRAALAAHGGPAWSHDELMTDVAYGLMYWVAGQPVTATMDLSHYGEHAERMGRRFRSFLEGTRDAAVRWDIASVLA